MTQDTLQYATNYTGYFDCSTQQMTQDTLQFAKMTQDALTAVCNKWLRILCSTQKWLRILWLQCETNDSGYSSVRNRWLRILFSMQQMTQVTLQYATNDAGYCHCSTQQMTQDNDSEWWPGLTKYAWLSLWPSCLLVILRCCQYLYRTASVAAWLVSD
jgi:hypothetical protein